MLGAQRCLLGRRRRARGDRVHGAVGSGGAVRKDVEHLVLECALKAQPAISFALKHRFVFCGFQDGYWPGQEVGIFFRKRLR